MTKQDLKSYAKLQKEIRQLEGMLRELDTRMYSPRIPHLTGMPGAQGSNEGGSAQERIADEIMTIRDRYQARVLDLIAQRKRIERAIEGLAEPDHRTILRARYIEGKSWTRISMDMHYHRATIDRKHGQALLALKDATLCDI